MHLTLRTYAFSGAFRARITHLALTSDLQLFLRVLRESLEIATLVELKYISINIFVFRH